MNNDLKTINDFELSRRVSSLLKGLTKATKFNFVLFAKQVAIGVGPPYRFYTAPSATLLLQNFSTATTDHRYQVLTAFTKLSKFSTAALNAFAEIDYLLSKSTGWAYLLFILQFG